MRTVVTVAKLGSLAAAAERLNIAQPALSRQVRLVENELETRLFVRHGRGMEPTMAGKIFIAKANRILSLTQDLSKSLSNDPAHMTGTVTIGMIPSAATLFAAPLLDRMRSSSPNLSINIMVGFSGFLDRWMNSGDLDLAITYGEAGKKRDDFVELVSEGILLVGARNSSIAEQKFVEPKNLIEYPLILPGSLHGLRRLIIALEEREQIRLNIITETNSMQIQKDLAAANVGFTILPSCAVTDEPHRLSAVPIGDPPLRRSIGLMRSRPWEMTVAADAVFDTLKDLMLNLAGSETWSNSKRLS